jgi:predicted methyltransferase
VKKPNLRFGAAFLLGGLVSCASGTSNAPKLAAATGPTASSQAAPGTSEKARPAPVSENALAVVNAPDRSEADKKLDPGRHPAELLSFFGVAPGMKVAEISAGGGYTTELLARAVGPGGKVYGQNSKWILERFAEKPWSERLAKPVMKNVVRADRDFGDPLPPEAKDLDAVFCVLFYHDMFWLDADRDKMNRAIYAALKPGGVYGVVDHSGRDGTGSTEVKTLHRIEEKVVRAEIEKAGFRLRAEGSFLRNPSDTRDWNDSPTAAGERRGTSDRFVLAFEKP